MNASTDVISVLAEQINALKAEFKLIDPHTRLLLTGMASSITMLFTYLSTERMRRNNMKLSLRNKIIIVLVVFAVLLSSVAAFVSWRTISRMRSLSRIMVY